MPKKSKPAKRQPKGVTGDKWQVTGKAKPLYRRPAPKPGRVSKVEPSPQSFAAPRSREPKSVGRASSRAVPQTANFELPTAKFLAPAHFELREDGSIQSSAGVPPAPHRDDGAISVGRDGVSPSQIKSESQGQRHAVPPSLIYTSDNPFIRLYHGNCLELLDAIAAKYPEGRFDAIFADPPYFLSNGGITCHAGKMVKVDKGDWDVSRGPELNHEFNTEWLRRCQKVLKPNGTIWVAGVPEIQTERIFHECKFVFLSSAQVERGAIVHTTVDVSLQEAWAKTPNGKKRETTHVVRFETEILRIKP